MMDKGYTLYKWKIIMDITKLFTFDLVPPPGFGNAKLFDKSFRNINRKNKIRRIFKLYDSIS